MNYIVGGTPRSGKSVLKRLLLERYRIPGFCTDYLRDALVHKVPEFGIKHGMSDAEKSELLWPYFRGILDQRQKYYEDDLLIEGTNFLPKYLKEFATNNKFRILFLGYSEVEPERKFKDIRTFPGKHDEWTKEISDHNLKKMVAEFIEISKYFKSECALYGIKYFDTSKNFNSVIEQAAEYLVGR